MPGAYKWPILGRSKRASKGTRRGFESLRAWQGFRFRT